MKFRKRTSESGGQSAGTGLKNEVQMVLIGNFVSLIRLLKLKGVQKEQFSGLESDA